MNRPCIFVLALLGLLATSPQVRAAGVQDDLIATLDGIAEKVVSLAEAMPADKYGWRPAGGVRSVSEVFVHIASTNYFLADQLGQASPPDAPPQNAEKTMTEKAQVVAALKKSMAHARQAIKGAASADLEKQVKLFGQQRSYRSVMILMIEHASEHLGQSIAYARMNSVVPPWSN
jgi:uncharacterized damage-inducible protein DinB